MLINIVIIITEASQILRSVDFTKTQKSRYLENETFFVIQKKLHIKGYFIEKNSLVAEVAFNHSENEDEYEK